MDIKADNDFLLSSFHLFGQPIIGPMLKVDPGFTTKQQAYRFAAYLIDMALVLPDEDPPSTFEEIQSAVRNPK
jgi:hypothetical protein